MRICNFGRNVCFKPKHYYQPKSEEEVLALLTRHRGDKIRVVGRLHSWSDATVGDDVIFDLRKMNKVRVELRNSESWATMEAGAQIKHIVAELESKHGLTLPTLGLITEQTIAGAAATGTHGSGKHSLSHYIDEIRIANYDPNTGEATIRRIVDGDELRAARCSLGCLGIVLSVTVRCRPQYLIEQHFRIVDQLSSVLDSEPNYPQQQFFVLPFRYDYLVQQRRETLKKVGLMTWLHRAYWFLSVDIALHIVLITLRRWLRSNLLMRLFYRYLVPLTIIRNWKVVDKSQHLLTMQHQLFRHIEVEIFVLRRHLPETLGFVRQLLQYLDGDQASIEQSTWCALEQHGLDTIVRESLAYTHHYPICVRKVLADDTFISMASSDQEAYYAISFISYDAPAARASFIAFADVLVRSTTLLFAARPHWGKYCSTDALAAEKLYPKLAAFRAVCEHHDVQGVFRNKWAKKVIWDEPKTIESESDSCY
jgi:hypothetical protein